MSEGRDNLDGVGLFSWGIAGAWEGWEASAVYALSETRNYDEVNIGLGRGFDLGFVMVNVGYTRLEFPEDGASDDEVALGLDPLWEWHGMEIAVEGVYSFDANGWFFEAALSRPWEFAGGQTLTPAVVMGWNEGYVSEGHRGVNHFLIQVEGEWPLTPSVALRGTMGYTVAVDADPAAYADDDALKNTWVTTLGLVWAF